MDQDRLAMVAYMVSAEQRSPAQFIYQTRDSSHSSFKSFRNIIQLLFVVLVTNLTVVAAEARLGDSLSAYKTHHAATLKASGQNGSDYMFEVIIDPRIQITVPGYAAGITITVTNNKISGQSMAIRLGMNPYQAGSTAASQGYDFVNEAIGKPSPKDKTQLEAETKDFTQAMQRALVGPPEHIQYPKHNEQIVLSRDNLGNLIIAVIGPSLPSPSSKPGKK